MNFSKLGHSEVVFFAKKIICFRGLVGVKTETGGGGRVMTNVVSLANNQEEGVWSRISTSTRSASFIICLPLQKSSNYFLPWRSYSNVCITIFPICSIKVRLLLEDDMYLR